MTEVAIGRTLRGASVTVGLSVAGGLAGAVVSSTTLAVVGLLVDGPGGFPLIWDAFVVAAAVGGVFGGVLAPLAGWGLLRQVPLGRAFGFTAAGTAVGGAAGLLVSALNPLVAIGGAIAGFVVTVGWLRRGINRSVETLETPAPRNDVSPRRRPR